jgi:hypothetical protein
MDYVLSLRTSGWNDGILEKKAEGNHFLVVFIPLPAMLARSSVAMAVRPSSNL